MSSATSIDDAVTPKTEIKKEAPGAFSPWHFFVLLSLVAASVAVVLARQNSAENLLLISLTIGAAGAAGFALYRMLAPFATAEAEPLGQPLSERLRADLEREKMLALRAIKELEFDRAMGKVSTQDFEEMASRLRARALGFIQQLDDGRTSYRAVIERELQARLDERQPDRPAERPQPHGGTCTCGTINDADASFCKHCGARLHLTEPAS